MKRFQAHFAVFHRRHLNPRAYASCSFAVYSAAFRQYFSFLSVFVDRVSVFILDLVVALNDYSHNSVGPRLLNCHHHSELSDSAEFLEEVQQVVVVG